MNIFLPDRQFCGVQRRANHAAVTYDSYNLTSVLSAEFSQFVSLCISHDILVKVTLLLSKDFKFVVSSLMGINRLNSLSLVVKYCH